MNKTGGYDPPKVIDYMEDLPDYTLLLVETDKITGSANLDRLVAILGDRNTVNVLSDEVLRV